MSKAAEVQQARVSADIQNHRERVVWLEQSSPSWACGTPVDAHSRNVLLLQSRNTLATAS